MRAAALRLALASVLASVLAAWGWTRYVAAPELWWTTSVAIVAVVGVGLALRLVPRVPSALIWLVQAAVAFGWVWWRPFEPASAQSTVTLLSAARSAIAGGTSPLPWSLGVVVLFVAVSLVFTLLDELLIHVAHAPVWTIAPLVGWFVVYAVLPRPQASPWSAAAVLVGFGSILLAATLNGQSRWGRGLPRARSGLAWLPTAALGLLVLALAVGAALGASSRWVAADRNGTFTRASGSLTVADPRIDLRQALHADPAGRQLTYTSSEPGGVHLRLAALTELDAGGWRMPSLPAKPLPAGGSGTLPAPEGLTRDATGVRSTAVRTELPSGEFLPAPYATQHLAGVGAGWGYDPATLTVYRLDRGAAASTLQYTTDSVDIEPTLDQLRDAPAGHVDDGTDEVPASVSQDFIAYTNAVTAHASTPQEKAAAIEDYLRSDKFHYDLSVPPPEVGGIAGITQFVMVTKTGYCEHFAAAMALMARISGIPSRVVVGFTPGEQQPDGSWLVTNKNMHAWPELYFAGWGWLRFEPTPGAVSGPPPAYSVGTQAANLAPSPSATPSQAPSDGESATPTVIVPKPTSGAAPVGPAAHGAPAWVGRVAGLLVALLLVLALLGAPAIVRQARRRRRLRDDGPPADRALDAWAEVRDTVVDLGGEWPARSPRELAALLDGRLDPEGRAALSRLVGLVERARYARSLEAAPPLGADVGRVRTQLRLESDQGRRWVAAWFPASVWKQLSPRAWWPSAARSRRSA